MMKKFQVSELAKIVIFIFLLLVIPFISSSLRTSYLYFLLNILIIVLGVEAGLLSAISGTRDEKKATIKVTPILLEAPLVNKTGPTYSNSTEATTLPVKPTTTPIEKPVVEKKVVAVMRVNKMKRCPSMPSLFFIGTSDVDEEYYKDKVDEDEDVDEGEEEVVKVEDVGDLSAQELFSKAEMFIGNFYKQLKIQREESWKKIHGLYHRAF